MAKPLPSELRYYSPVTFPQPQRISLGLHTRYRKRSAFGGRNVSQVIFRDQVLRGSTLMAHVNADHWAVAVPIARSHKRVRGRSVTQNAYPGEALLEAMPRFVEEDLTRERKHRGKDDDTR
jgi:hypothetical protein